MFKVLAVLNKAPRGLGQNVNDAAVRGIEGTAVEMVRAAMPADDVGGQSRVAPAELYTVETELVDGTERRADHPTCAAMFTPNGRDGRERALDYYASVLDTGAFEKDLCPRALADLGSITRGLVREIPAIVERDTASGVKIASMVARAKRNGDSVRVAIAGALQAALLESVIREVREPESGLLTMLVGANPRSAEDLRNAEVVHRILEQPKPTAIVERARAAAWDAIVANKPIDMARFGSRHAYAPALGKYTTTFSPDRSSGMTDETMAALGRWGVTDSLISSVHDASSRARERAERAHPVTTERAVEAAGALRGLYVTEQHVGYESAGVGYAIVVAHGALRQINDAAYAHAASCLLEYVRDLVFLGERVPEAAEAAIEQAVARLAPLPSPKAPQPYSLPRVPLACRGTPPGHDARTQRVIRRACALNDELVQKSLAVSRLRESLGTDQAASGLTLERMFALHDDLDAVALLGDERGAFLDRADRALQRLKGKPLGTEERRAFLDRANRAFQRLKALKGSPLARKETKEETELARAQLKELLSESARLVTETRRVVVLRHKILALRGATLGRTKMDAPYEGVYDHIARCANANELCGLNEAELGIMHTTYEAAGQIAYRWPMLEAARDASFAQKAQKAVAWLVRGLMPTCVSDVAEAGAEAMRGRVVQYKSTESPGVGYALYALIPILDHASTMSRVSDQYEPLKGATLRAIKRLLEHRPARDKRDP